ncbi:MAG: CDP-glucose 4,6-dehydratase [Pirellulales bacterium]
MQQRLTSSFAGLRVLITGHTGFKGSWLALWTQSLGAEVFGYSLGVPTMPSNYTASKVSEILAGEVSADICDRDRVRTAVGDIRPDVVFHLAAQTIVKTSYESPCDTFETNVMGTAYLLDAIRQAGRPCSVVVVTSDKCYENSGSENRFSEHDRLGGHDPYSASKAAAELAVASYRRSFFPAGRLAEHGVKLATVRAGNVIGGGDWADCRILPDAARALSAGQPVFVRSPNSVRPWQHVLDALGGYLLLAANMVGSDDPRWCDGWNFGPAAESEIPVSQLIALFCDSWGDGRWQDCSDSNPPHEAKTLRLSIEKAKLQLAWQPQWTVAEAVRRTAGWYRQFYTADGSDSMRAVCLADISDYEKLPNGAAVACPSTSLPEKHPTTPAPRTR